MIMQKPSAAFSPPFLALFFPRMLYLDGCQDSKEIFPQESPTHFSVYGQSILLSILQKSGSGILFAGELLEEHWRITSRAANRNHLRLEHLLIPSANLFL